MERLRNLKEELASVLAQTAEQIKPGTGRDQVQKSDIHLDDIQHGTSRVFPEHERIMIAIRIAFVERDPGGDPVTSPKVRGGLVAVGTSTLILAHEMSMARFSTNLYFTASMSAQPIEVMTKNGQTPGMRMTLPDMKTVAFGIEPVRDGNPETVLAIRDEIIETIAAAGAPASPERAPSAEIAALNTLPADAAADDAPMGSEAQREAGAAVFAFASDLLQSALAAGARLGDDGLCWQAFDADPNDDSVQLQLSEQRLSLEESRAFLKSRISEGFKGLAGFSCREGSAGAFSLRVEAFDVRSGASVALSVGLRRTFMGKYRSISEGTFHGSADPL